MEFVASTAKPRRGDCRDGGGDVDGRGGGDLAAVSTAAAGAAGAAPAPADDGGEYVAGLRDAAAAAAAAVAAARAADTAIPCRTDRLYVWFMFARNRHQQRHPRTEKGREDEEEQEGNQRRQETDRWKRKWNAGTPSVSRFIT